MNKSENNRVYYQVRASSWNNAWVDHVSETEISLRPSGVRIF